MAILTSIKVQSPRPGVFRRYGSASGADDETIEAAWASTAQLLGGDGMQTPEYIKLAGADAEGEIASNPGLALDAMPGGKAFKDKFTARFGPIQNYAPYAYDAAYVLVDAMKRANSTDPAKYLPELAQNRLPRRDRTHPL